MILTVTLNLAIDVTYRLAEVHWGKTNQVRPAGRRAGGKGVNVARTLDQLGREVIVTGLAGGLTGAAARAELAATGLIDATVEVAGTSRTTLVVVEDDGEVTGFSEPGPQVSAEEWGRFVATFSRLVARSRAVALSGSLPPGVPVDAYGRLVAIATEAHLPVLLDSSGEPLAHGIAARPAIVKINADELSGIVSAPDLVTGAGHVCELGAAAAVISSGADGLVAVTDQGAWQAGPPEHIVGNPIGAGDAASAALAAGLADGTPWPERLADAAALSAASVAAPLAGSFDSALYRRLRGEIVAEQLHWG